MQSINGRMVQPVSILLCVLTLIAVSSTPSLSQDAKNRVLKKPQPERSPELAKYGIYHKTAPRADGTEPMATSLPLEIRKGARIAMIGNGLFDRARHFAHFEAMLHKRFPDHQLVVRNLAWSGDTPDLQPRPENFADLDQHLTFEKIDIIFAAFGFNESFAGDAGLHHFRHSLTKLVSDLRSKAFNGRSGPQIVLVSPIANENVESVQAANANNDRIAAYTRVVQSVAEEQRVAFVDVFGPTDRAMRLDSELTINGVHLNDAGYAVFASALYSGILGEDAVRADKQIRQAIVDKNRQYFRRYRPLNTFYYTGGRNKSYGYLDFLPAMRNFDIMVSNREKRIWQLAQGRAVPPIVDDSKVPPLPQTRESRGANRWMTAADEAKSFKVDPRFEVTLFAGEEEFADIGAPIQIRWDAKGRLWVSCSTTYPHVYPGNEPNDKLVILEDTDGDGKADRSTVFADDLHIPLSFEFGDGGVYVSEMPDLTFIKDTDGDGKADYRRRLFTGFGTEDSHHALHDFVWTPDGDLIFREGIFHHSQVETAYGPVRQRNSGWFRFRPDNQRLTSFGSYHSTNPWGVTFDDWGQHLASHPIYAAAFHSLDPPYPLQHPRPTGLQAYSGTCGQEFIDFDTFPEEMQGGFVKARYKPTNRIEFHRWREKEFGFDEEYVSDLIFSSNLSFIPVDIRFGPRGALYVCDWYNPVKGHAQYSLRDERRDRHSGRIWRITTKGKSLTDAPAISGAPIESLLNLLTRKEYRYRYWAKRELRERNRDDVRSALDRWVKTLDASEPRYRQSQLEALWMYRAINSPNAALLTEVLTCDNHMARAAATRQLRYLHQHIPNKTDVLRRLVNDPNAIVRMEAAIAASYIGGKESLEALLDIFKHPSDKHLAYAIHSALGSASLRPHWKNKPELGIAKRLNEAHQQSQLREPTPSASQAEFDSQKNLKSLKISCIPERMKFTIERFAVQVGQPVKLVFMNPDATDHNLVIVKPGALEEVGMAANDMAKNPRHANSNFIPKSKRRLILQSTPMIGPSRRTRVHALRFAAPKKPGIYPYVCTFPGHWVVMKGEMIVVNDLSEVDAVLAAREPKVIKEWQMSDFTSLDEIKSDETTVMRGMQAFMKARCNQCHAAAGHGVNLGPDLKDVSKRYQGKKLLRQLIEPSSEIGEKFQNHRFLMEDGRSFAGVIVRQNEQSFFIMENLLTPNRLQEIDRESISEQVQSKVSPMPDGLLNILRRNEIEDLLSYLQNGGYKLPHHLQHNH